MNLTIRVMYYNQVIKKKCSRNLILARIKEIVNLGLSWVLENFKCFCGVDDTVTPQAISF